VANLERNEHPKPDRPPRKPVGLPGRREPNPQPDPPPLDDPLAPPVPIPVDGTRVIEMSILELEIERLLRLV
jgi:hypothetical protein